MAGKIRGITIELSADASGVLNSVQQINKQIKTTSSQLRDVDRLLKLDPTNTTLLTQKTQMLQKQIGETKTKLTELKAAQADMDANGVDKNSEQYQALQREIIATEQDLKRLEGTAGSGSAALAKVSTVTGQIGDKMQDVGKKLSVVSAALAALGAAAIAAFNQVDAGADIVITKTGATGEAAKALESSYKNVAKNIVADFTDIGAAVGEINTRFGLTGTELEDLSETFLQFAQINGVDVESAVQGVDKALKTFNMDQSEASNVMGLLTSVAQQTGISMDELLGLLQSSGPAFKEMGLDIDDAITLMGNFESAGLDSSDMLSRLQKAAAYYNSQGKDMKTGLSDLISRLQNSATEAEATAEAYEIFGKRGGLAFIQAAKEGKISISNLSRSLDDYSSVVSDTYEETLDGTDKMKLAWQNLQLGLAELGSVIGEVLAPIMDKITSVIQSVVEWFGNLDEGTKKTIVTIGLIVAAIGPLLVIGGKVMSGISAITGALSAMGTISAGPIGLVIAGVAAVAAGVTALQSALNKAHEEASPFTEALSEMAERNSDLASSIETTRSAYQSSVEASEASAFAAQTMAEHLQSLIAGYDGTAESAAEIEAVINELNELVPGLGLSWDSVTNSLNLTNQEIYANIEAMRAQAQVAALQDMYTESLKNQYEAQKNLSESAVTLRDVTDSYGLSLNDVISAMTSGSNSAYTLQQMLFNAGVPMWDLQASTKEVAVAFAEYVSASNNAEDAASDVAFAETELGNAMKTAAAATASAKTEMTNAANDINSDVNFDPAIQSATKSGQEIPQQFADNIAAGTPSVETASADMATAVTDAVADVPSDMNTTGTEAGSNMDSGLQTQLEPVRNTIATMVSYFGTETAQLGMGMYNLAVQALTGFAGAITTETAAQVVPAIQALVSGIATNMQPLPTAMYNIGNQAGQGLYNGLAAWQGTLSSLAWGIANSINAAARAALQIRSPSRVLQEVGEYSGEGLEKGLEKSAKGVFSTASGIATTMATALQPDLSGLKAMNSGMNASARSQAASGSGITLGSVVSLLSQYLPYLAENNTVVLDDGTLVGKIAPAMNTELRNLAIRSARG